MAQVSQSVSQSFGGAFIRTIAHHQHQQSHHKMWIIVCRLGLIVRWGANYIMKPKTRPPWYFYSQLNDDSAPLFIKKARNGQRDTVSQPATPQRFFLFIYPKFHSEEQFGFAVLSGPLYYSKQIAYWNCGGSFVEQHISNHIHGHCFLRYIDDENKRVT